MKSVQKMIPSFDGTELYFNKEIPDSCKAILVIAHGLCEHQGRYDYFAEKLHECGFGTYRYDQRGHGRSGGTKTHFDGFNQPLDDCNTVVDMAIAENPELPVFLLGHSMGGFTVSLFGAKYPGKRLSGILTSGAISHDAKGTTKIPDGYDVTMRVPNELGHGVCSVQEIVDIYNADPLNSKDFTIGLCYALRDGVKWFEEASASFSYPVLMMHGEKDAIVSVEDTYRFFNEVTSTDKQMKIYGGLFHEILNEYCRDEVISDVIRWMTARM